MENEAYLILVRHGQSDWNQQNIFTGWVDVPLSAKGIQEAEAAGKQIQDIPIDKIYTSSLIRAQMTAMLMMREHKSGTPVVVHKDGSKMEKWARDYNPHPKTIPVMTAWELNERMYGELQGLNKDATREKFGNEQVEIWRRSYDVAPPGGESLEMTAARTLPYFDTTILPELHSGKNILVSAHGNSLRSIVMELDHLQPEEVVKLEIPTGVPLCYHFFKGALHKVSTAEVAARYRAR